MRYTRREWLRTSAAGLAGCWQAGWGLPSRSRLGMVVAEEPLAAEVGANFLRKGGNAIDAAVAVAFTLAVTYPQAGNLGGGGFLLYRRSDGWAKVVDFREVAPRRATEELYRTVPSEAAVVGPRACAVPGTVRGLGLAQRRYGRLKWAELLQPAIELAERGFPVPFELAEELRRARHLGRFAESRRVYLKDGHYWQPGEQFHQPELARTLRRIAEQGPEEFYEGETARLIVAAMEPGGGLIGLEDLRAYQPLEREPLVGQYRGWQVVTVPPPSSGGVGLLQVLGMLEESGYERCGWGSADAIHFVAEALRRFFADRACCLADPAFYSVPLERLLAPAYLARRRSGIDWRRATPSQMLGAWPDGLERERAQTTHVSVLDQDGNAVALTYTLNGLFGSGVTVPRAGFLLNNEMDDFATRPGQPNQFGLVQGPANRVEPGKRPLSSMAPTILVRDGFARLVLGSPGGPRIVSAVLEVVLNMVDFKMEVHDAVDAPRFHHQWRPDALVLEPGFSPDTVKLLQMKGHRVARIANVGKVGAIAVQDGWMLGVADRRGYGRAAGV